MDGVVISTDSHTLHDDFRNEVIGRPTHRPFGRDEKLCTLRKRTIGKGTYLEHNENVDRLGKTKVGNLND